MAEVLVLVDHVDGACRKTTSELLTIARRLGEPSAVFVGSGFDAAKETLAAFGAEKVYRADAAALTDYLVVPQAELLAHLVEKVSPAAVLVASSAEGKEIAARLAVKIGSGLITDAVDVQSDGCLLYTSPSPRDRTRSRMPSSACKKTNNKDKKKNMEDNLQTDASAPISVGLSGVLRADPTTHISYT